MEDNDRPSSLVKVRRIEEKEIVMLAHDAEEMVKQLKEKFQ